MSSEEAQQADAAAASVQKANRHAGLPEREALVPAYRVPGPLQAAASTSGTPG